MHMKKRGVDWKVNVDDKAQRISGNGETSKKKSRQKHFTGVEIHHTKILIGVALCSLCGQLVCRFGSLADPKVRGYGEQCHGALLSQVRSHP